MNNNSNNYVLLISDDQITSYTSYLLLNSEYPPCGIVVATYKGIENRLKYEKIIIKNIGLISRLSQILLSLIYKLIEGRSDAHMLKQLYNGIDFEDMIRLAKIKKVPILKLHSFDYNHFKAIDFINSLNPFYIVCHTPFWLSSKIRSLSRSKLTVGSHPGIVPWYRGANSSFWSIFNKQNELNGYSFFFLDSGIDSGRIIKQTYIDYSIDFSHISNDYILMNRMSKDYINIVRDFSCNLIPKGIVQTPLTSSQIYKSPGLLQYLYFKINLFIRNKLVK